MAENKGAWLDTKSNKVVDSPPEEGIQLLAPGMEPSPDEVANLERVKASLGGDEKAPKALTTKAANK